MSFNKLNNYLKECVKKKKIPGCVCLIGNEKQILFSECYGYAQITPKKIKMTKDTLFDLASITKPIATALSIMLLYEKKKLKLGDRVERFLSDFKNRPNGKKTIKELLTHTSGIRAWFPTYLLSKKSRIEFLATINTEKRGVIYSCLGYIILGKVIEAIAGSRLDSYCSDNVFKKLGLKNMGFGPIKRKINIAATEFGNEHEKQMALKYGDISSIEWRDYLIKGEVHDGNSFYSYGGISGNAGLFSNATDLMKIMRAYCNGNIVKSSTLSMMTRDHTSTREQRGLGWVINPYPGLLSARAFGHTGFTGTMLTIDPNKNLIIILLANAIHPNVKIGVMPKVRRKVVRIISDCLV